MFSIADIQAQEEDPAFDEEGAEEDGRNDEPIHSYGIRVAFSVTKVRVSSFARLPCLTWPPLYIQPDAPGALSIDTVCQEGAFIVDAISFYKDAKIGTELSADADWKRRGLYIGPQVPFLPPFHSYRTLIQSVIGSLTPSTWVFKKNLRNTLTNAGSMRV